MERVSGAFHGSRLAFMVRRFISSCVLAGFCVAHWAALPHAHATGTELRGDHDTTPHVHLEALGVSTRSCTADGPSSELGWLTCDCALCCADHDAHALYLPTLSTLRSAASQDQCRLLSIPTVLHFCEYLVRRPLEFKQFLQATLSVRGSALACALYLALCALRI
jgi:hypothetical protein